MSILKDVLETKHNICVTQFFLYLTVYVIYLYGIIIKNLDKVYDMVYDCLKQSLQYGLRQGAIYERKI